MNARRSLLLILLLAGFLLLAFVLRDDDPSADNDTGRTLSLHIPRVSEANISSEELREIIDTLLRTHRGFSSLPYARIEYRVFVTKSDAQYQRDIAEMNGWKPIARADPVYSKNLCHGQPEKA